MASGDCGVGLGFQFKPSDQILLQCLREKLQGHPLSCGDSIKEDNVYDCHPQTIIDRRAIGVDRSSCYVFTTTKRRSGSRPVRTCGTGRWHATQGERPVLYGGYSCNQQAVVLGHKISLAYYDGDGRKTQWLMDEYFVKEFRDHNKLGTGAAGTDRKRKRIGGGGGGHAAGDDQEVLDRWVVCYLHPSPRKTGPTWSKCAYLVQDQHALLRDGDQVQEAADLRVIEEVVLMSSTTTTTTTAANDDREQHYSRVQKLQPVAAPPADHDHNRIMPPPELQTSSDDRAPAAAMITTSSERSSPDPVDPNYYGELMEEMIILAAPLLDHLDPWSCFDIGLEEIWRLEGANNGTADHLLEPPTTTAPADAAAAGSRPDLSNTIVDHDQVNEARDQQYCCSVIAPAAEAAALVPVLEQPSASMASTHINAAPTQLAPAHESLPDAADHLHRGENYYCSWSWFHPGADCSDQLGHHGPFSMFECAVDTNPPVEAYCPDEQSSGTTVTTSLEGQLEKREVAAPAAPATAEAGRKLEYDHLCSCSLDEEGEEDDDNILALLEEPVQPALFETAEADEITKWAF